MKYLFSEKEKLKKATLFRNVIECGKKYKSKFITIYLLVADKEERKAGFSVSGKIKSACLRHRIKRRLKEAYRLNVDKLKNGFYMVIIGREGIEKIKFKEIENILFGLFAKAKILCGFLFIFCFVGFSFADTITIGGVGDTYLGGNAEKFIKKYGMEYPFKNVKDILDECNIVIANLEAPFTNATATYAKKSYYLKVQPEFVESLKSSGIDIVSLSNNHTMDYGKKGLSDTIKVLKKTDIGYTGAGMTIKEASEPYTVELKGIKCSFLSFGAISPTKFYANKKRAGVAPADESFLIETIARAKKEADLVVVSFHWGKELAKQPDYYQIHLAHTAIESGANLVLGHHPHVVQGIEYYLDGVIAYSLGNFVFGSYSNKVKNSIILQATFEKEEKEIRLSQIKIVPISIENKKVLFQPKILKDKEAQDVLQEISKIVNARGTNLKVENDRGILEPMPVKERLQAIAQNYLKIQKYKLTNNSSGGNIIVPSSSGKYHIVKRKDTLSGIAKKYKVKLAYLKKLNNIQSSLIYPKQVIMIHPPQKVAIKSEPMPATNLETEELDETTISIIEASLEYLGFRYRFGGNGEKAIDCSALIQKAFKSKDISLPRTARGQFEVGEVVKELKPGDLLFFATRAPFATHVGMYLGNNEFIHASRGDGVCVTNILNPYYASHFIGAKRVFNNEKTTQQKTERAVFDVNLKND